MFCWLPIARMKVKPRSSPWLLQFRKIPLPVTPSAGGYFFAAARLAQISFILAESLALAAALILRFGFGAGLTAGFATVVAFFTLAHRALAAALILALAAALILNFFFGAGAMTAFGEGPKSFSNSFSRA